MAAGLNPPSIFTSCKDTSTKNMNLLPPSAFESKRSGDPWKELARTTGELIHLKLENQQLKEDKKQKPDRIDLKDEIRARVDVHKISPMERDTSRHLDDLIQRQAAEIAQLKEEVRSLQADHKLEVVGLEKEIAIKERQHSQYITSLEAELKSKGDNYEYQVDRLSVAHQQEVDSLLEKINKLTSEVEELQTSSLKQITELQNELTTTTEANLSTIGALKQDLLHKSSTINELENQALRLKKYIGESEKGPTPVEVWRKDKATLEKKQTELESERESLSSTVQLLNIRLSAANDILSLQEKELAKTKIENIDKSKQESYLLTRWREKVYALLVQQKSADIVTKKDFQNWKEKLKNTEDQLYSYKNQIEVLTCTLSDKDAQLEIERNQNKSLLEDLTSAQKIAITLDDQLSNNNMYTETIKNTLLNFSEKFSETEKATLESLKTFNSYGQRISFATGRVEMLQAQFARKEAHLRLQIGERKKTPAERDIPQHQGSGDSQGSPVYLQEELSSVTKERDTLAAQIRQDSLALEEKMSACRQEVESEVLGLKSRVQHLETEVNDKNEKCCKMESSIEKLESEMEEREERIRDLNLELGKQQQLSEQALKEREGELREEFSERLSSLERELGEAKREHVKAVVSLRQCQRQTSRDKERYEETSRLAEETHNRQIEKLQQQLHAIEKERNIMMTTLRQEGLMGEIKLRREEPIRVEDGAGSEVMEKVLPPSGQEQHSEEVLPEEPLSSVLEDLESLTAAVIDDDSDSD